MYTQSDYEQYYVIASLTGLVIGSTPALSRGYLSKIIPPEKRAELFGFNALASRIAALLGPLIFGVIASLYNMRFALLTVLPFFVIGVILFIILGIKGRR